MKTQEIRTKSRITSGSNGRASAVTGFARVGLRLVGLTAKPAPVPSVLVPPGQGLRLRSPLIRVLYGPSN